MPGKISSLNCSIIDNNSRKTDFVWQAGILLKQMSRISVIVCELGVFCKDDAYGSVEMDVEQCAQETRQG